jgi:hypothetical protein
MSREKVAQRFWLLVGYAVEKNQDSPGLAP